MNRKISIITAIIIFAAGVCFFASGRGAGTVPKSDPTSLFEPDVNIKKPDTRLAGEKQIAEPAAVRSPDLSQYSDGDIKKMKFEVDQGSVVIDPWLNGFNYRKEITISSGSALTYYPVKVSTDTSTLVSNSKLQSDCDDLRFTSSDGYTAIDYWIESGCNTGTTVVWVEVPSVASGSTTIYMYYGNSAASVASNGANTFEVFADFTTSIPSGWTTPVVTSYASYTFENGDIVLYGGVRDKSSAYWYGNSTAYNTDVVLNGKIIETRFKAYQFGSYRSYQYAYVDGLMGGGWVLGRYKLYNSWLQLVEGTTLRWYQTSWDGALTGYYILGLAYDGNYRKVFEDYTLKTSYNAGSAQANGKGGVQGTMADTTGNGKYEAYFDWYRMRKFTASEPTASVGSEKQLVTMSGTGATSWSWKAPASGEYVPSGSATNWAWTAWSNNGAGLTVPDGSATGWTWYP